MKDELQLFKRLLAYSDRYNISFQMWPNQYTIYIDKDYVALWDFGSDEPLEPMRRALEYLDRINGIKRNDLTK